MTVGLQNRAGVMEYWSGGMMDQNQAETHQPWFKANRSMIICPVNAIRQKTVSGWSPIILATLKGPAMHCPLLPYSNTPLLL